jgi:general stress protein 26
MPTTKLDTTFSDSGTTATSWDDTRTTLEVAELYWIATVRADGRPHMTPLVAVWLDDALHFCTGDAEQKAVNLRNNQNVILMTGCNQWDGGLDVVVEGRAVRVTDRGTLQRLAEAWSRKWDGRWQYEIDRWRLSGRCERGRPGVLRATGQGLRVRQRQLQPHAAHVLRPMATAIMSDPFICQISNM